MEYSAPYHARVVRHILEIQNEEFGLGLTLEDQPDLVSIEATYLHGGGNFWIALDEDDEVVGTIAIMNLGQNAADLRKMFVKPGWRGKEHGVSRGLLDILVRWAEENGYQRIYLETISLFKAAVKFYTGNGFRRIDRSQLPHSFR